MAAVTGAGEATLGHAHPTAAGPPAARRGGIPAMRLTAALVKVGILFALASATVLAIVWGGAHLLGIGGTEWVGVLNIVAIVLVLVMITATLLTLAERKWSARMQNRIGPNRARLFRRQKGALFGLPHIIADVLKMVFKEDFVPPSGSKVLFNLAPVMAFAPALALMAVVPIGPDFTAFGTEVRFQVARLDVGLLFIFAIASLAVYGTTLAGWSANNKFALLGGLRATAQMISYEVTLALTLVGSFILYETIRPHEMVAFQQGTMWGGVVPAWGVFFQPFALVFFLAAAFAEIKRAPFDLPEGESEIIGYFVEYSGMKFGLFMIAEFAEIVVLSAVIVVIFFGGWSIPWVSHEALVAWLSGTVGLGPDWGALAGAFIALFVFIAKMMFFVWLQMLIRWSFPRFRYDQIMDLGWKMLLPLSIANVFITAVAVVLDPSLNAALVIGLVQLVALLAIIFSAAAPTREEALPEEAASGGH